MTGGGYRCKKKRREKRRQERNTGCVSHMTSVSEIEREREKESRCNRVAPKKQRDDATQRGRLVIASQQHAEKHQET